MEELKLSSAPKIKVVFDEKEYLVRKPKVFEVRKLEKDLTDPDPAVKSEATFSFIAECGLPRDVLEQVDIDGLNAIVELLMPKKKA